MARYLNYGETAVRPGTYFNYDKKDNGPVAGASDGTTAILFKSNWGPLNQIVQRSADEGYKDDFGTGGTTRIIALSFEGGTKNAILIRVGTGGTAAAVTLKNSAESAADAVRITAKYVGSRSFTVSVRDSIADDTLREVIIYDGTSEFEKRSFTKGGDEVAACVEAFADSENFIVAKAGSVTGALATVTQAAFTDGTDPTATAAEYSEALELAGTLPQNCICIDTSDYSIISLLNAYVTRMFNGGNNVIAVVGEPKTVALATRIQHAAACNLANMVDVINGNVDHGVYGTIDGYETAAKICGMISGISCKYSLTHTVMSGITKLNERLKDSEIKSAELSGGLVLTENPTMQVWIDAAITTLVTPAANQDAGWKKIRRTKTRFELLTRCNNTIDEYVGQVDNDNIGRLAIKDAIETVGIAMKGEGKINSLAVSEDASHPADGDSCWFIIDVIDKDSAEHIYLRYLYSFSTRTSEEG